MVDQNANCGKAVYDTFFDHGDVRSFYKKQFISLWDGWLGNDRLHLLDEVGEGEWLRFNRMLLAASEIFRIGVVDRLAETVVFPDQLGPMLSDYQESMQKDSSQFSQFVIPELDCVITEEWDYTYILWYRNVAALEAVEPLITQEELKLFAD